MSCHGCAETFGFMKKEYGCPKCGFSYCKKCLRFTIVDPKTSKKMQVCTKCHQSVSATKEPLAVINALQRLESMDDPAKPPIIVYQQQQARSTTLHELKKGMSMEDQRLLERLESLKKKDDNGGDNKRSSKRRSSEQEIEERLARLKGEEYDPSARNRPVNLRNVTPETEEDLLAKFAAELELESRYEAGVVGDIEERLLRLRGENPAADTSDTSNLPSTSSLSSQLSSAVESFKELSDEEQVQLMLEKLQNELELEKKTGVPIDPANEMDVDASEQPENIGSADSDDDDIDVDELCGICSEKRATLICKECDDDIYCKACFMEMHRELGEMHASKALKKK